MNKYTIGTGAKHSLAAKLSPAQKINAEQFRKEPKNGSPRSFFAGGVVFHVSVAETLEGLTPNRVIMALD